MKNILFQIFFLISVPCGMLAQVYVTGINVKIDSGAILYSTGDVTITGSSSVIIKSGGLLSSTGVVTIEGSANLFNNGTVETSSDINIIDTATVQGSGQYTLQGDWTNSAKFIAGTSTVTFGGATNSSVSSGGDAFYNLKLAKTSADLWLNDDMTVSHNLEFVSDNNHIFITYNNLTFGPSATVTGYDNNDYIITEDSGTVKKMDLGTTAFLFPVGSNYSTYNPITLVQSASGVVDNFSVRVLKHVLANGNSGIILTQGVSDASWEVTDSLPGGSDLTLTTQWAGTDELPVFNRNDCGISRYDGTGWDLTNVDAGMASGVDPYSRTRSGVSQLGYFAVGGVDLMTYVAVAPKVFLQGSYSTSTHLMSDNLRTIHQNPPNDALILLPRTEPYSALSNFTHVGRGGGETVNASVFNNTGDINNDIVDWVFLELRDKNTSSLVLQTRSALVQRDGDIVDIDGISPVRFVGVPGDNYYLTVRHRNHLGVRTPNTLTLSRTATGHDFTTSMASAYKPTGFQNEPMAEPEAGVFALWGGNANGNTNVRYSGPTNDQNQLLNICLGGDKGLVLQKQYTRCDLNMNGTTKYSGPTNDQNFLLNTVLGGVKGKVISQPTF